MQRHIELASGNRDLDEIPCPEPGCHAFLSFEQMQSYAPAEVFERYDAALRQSALDAADDYCKCSNPACAAGGFYDPGDSYIICICGAQTCVTCRTAGHPGLTHEENTERIRVSEELAEQASLDEIKSAEYLKTSTKACPKCGQPIVKHNGCDHMTCRSRDGRQGEWNFRLARFGI